MKIQCPHCQHTCELPDSHAGDRVTCPACGQPHTLTANPDFVHATLSRTHPVIDDPPDDGLGLVVLGWLLIVLSVVLALPSNGVSLAGILPGIFLVGLGKLIGHNAKTVWYLKKIYEQYPSPKKPSTSQYLKPKEELIE